MIAVAMSVRKPHFSTGATDPLQVGYLYCRRQVHTNVSPLETPIYSNTKETIIPKYLWVKINSQEFIEELIFIRFESKLRIKDIISAVIYING